MAKHSTASKTCCYSKANLTYILGSRLLSDFSSIEQEFNGHEGVYDEDGREEGSDLEACGLAGIPPAFDV